MKLFGLLTLSLLITTAPAFALSTQAGTGLPDSQASIADPDGDMPAGLQSLGAAATRDNLGDNYSGGGFISKDKVEQSEARGAGSFIKPEPQR